MSRPFPAFRRPLARPFLVLVVACCLVFAGSTVGLSLWSRAERDRAAALTRGLDQTIRLNADLRKLMNRHSELANRADTSFPPSTIELQRVHFDASRRLNRYLGLTRGLAERHAVETVRRMQSDLASAVQRVVLLRQLQRTAAADEELERARRISHDIETQLDALSAISASRLHEALSDDGAERMTMSVMVLAALALGVSCVVFLVLLRRRVLLPLSAIGEAADRIAGSRFDGSLPVDGDDELAHLAGRINSMSRRLAEAQQELSRAVAARTAELEQAHERLLQSEKMSAVGRLVSGVAHELNNPLTAIMGYAELLQERFGSDHEVAPQIDTVLEQAERSRKIIADLLQFARQRPTTRERLDLAATVGAAVELWRHSARTAEIDLRSCPATEPCVIDADPSKVQQVVLALLNNAGDAAREGAAAPRIEVSTVAEAGLAVVRVTDNGPGVAEPARVFEPFYTTKEVGSGTGLGLSIAYGIAVEHGGTLTLDSLPGGGAVAELRLPLVEERARVADVKSVAPSSGARRSGRALVVDDEPQVLAIEIKSLERLGFSCSAADSGIEAIRLLEREPFDLILTDLRMPGKVNGIDLHEWIRAERPRLADRVLFVTGDLVNVECARESLPGPYLLKPFGFDELRGAVDQLLRVEPTT